MRNDADYFAQDTDQHVHNLSSDDADGKIEALRLGTVVNTWPIAGRSMSSLEPHESGKQLSVRPATSKSLASEDAVEWRIRIKRGRLSISAHASNITPS